MIDFNRIPESLYEELVDLFGKDQAEKYINKVNYNISKIHRDLFLFKAFKSYKKNKWALIMIVLLIIGAIIFTFF